MTGSKVAGSSAVEGLFFLIFLTIYVNLKSLCYDSDLHKLQKFRVGVGGDPKEMLVRRIRTFFLSAERIPDVSLAS